MKLKAISLHQPSAEMIASREKTIETRRWSTSYRGQLLICSTVRKCETPGIYYGSAVALTELRDCRPMTSDDEQAACCALYPGAFAWVLGDIRRILPFPVRGKHRLFEVEVGRIVIIEPAARCKDCGCTEDDCAGCIARTGKPCHWVEPDVCSACVDACADTAEAETI